MRLLLDQNLSRYLPDRLADFFPESVHVSHIGLSRSTDLEVWFSARSNQFVIVSKDSDFNDILFLRGFPPYVVWIQRGNCSTNEIESLIRQKRSEIERLPESGNGLLIIR